MGRVNVGGVKYILLSSSHGVSHSECFKPHVIRHTTFCIYIYIYIHMYIYIYELDTCIFLCIAIRVLCWGIILTSSILFTLSCVLRAHYFCKKWRFVSLLPRTHIYPARITVEARTESSRSYFTDLASYYCYCYYYCYYYY